MPFVTVQGGGATISVPVNSAANAAYGQQLVAAANAAAIGGTLTVSTIAGGNLAPVVPEGNLGLLNVLSTTATAVTVPGGYRFVTDSDAATTASGSQAITSIQGNGTQNQVVILGTAGEIYDAGGGSGTVIAGGGNNFLGVANPTTTGFNFVSGAGDDTIFAIFGNDTVNAGGGTNHVLLGTGDDQVYSSGNDLINLGAGHATISVTAQGIETVTGGAGTGSATIYGGAGGGSFQGGAAGNNFIIGGLQSSTLTGGGDNDLLIATGRGSQVLNAASGNETLIGSAQANNVFYAGSGNTTMSGGPGNNIFWFDAAKTGGAGTTHLITDFAQTPTQQDFVGLAGFTDPHGLTGTAAVADIINSVVHGAVTSGSDTTVTLPDGTKVVLAGVTSVNGHTFGFG